MGFFPEVVWVKAVKDTFFLPAIVPCVTARLCRKRFGEGPSTSCLPMIAWVSGRGSCTEEIKGGKCWNKATTDLLMIFLGIIIML